jgi:spermidine/putrescine transport system substrate-binding protein
VNIRYQVDNPEDFKFQQCREGLPVGSDNFVIPVNAEHPGTALLFIETCSSPRTRRIRRARLCRRVRAG